MLLEVRQPRNAGGRVRVADGLRPSVSLAAGSLGRKVGAFPKAA